MKLNDKIALITGGTTGIGFETARLFRDEGARVIVTGVNPQRIEQAARELGPDVLVLRADLREADQRDSVIATVRERFGELDVLFANAGIGALSNLADVTEAQFDDVFGVNVKGLFFTVQQAVPLMRKGGSIVLATSFLNEVGVPGLSLLSASKAAVRSLARTLSVELAGQGVRVNAVSPGPISTPFHGKLGLTASQLDQAAAGIEAQVPMHRFGEAAEIARSVLFLASGDSSFMTGAELVVDGGRTQL